MTKERPNFEFVASKVRGVAWRPGQRPRRSCVCDVGLHARDRHASDIGTVPGRERSRSRVIFMKSLAVLIENAEKLLEDCEVVYNCYTPRECRACIVGFSVDPLNKATKSGEEIRPRCVPPRACNAATIFPVHSFTSSSRSSALV